MTVKPPPVPKKAPQTPEPLTDIERWYLDNFIVLARYLKRSPSITEFAGWLGRAVTPCYAALLRCEAKGWLLRPGKLGERKGRRFSILVVPS